MTPSFRRALYFVIPVVVFLDQLTKWMILNEDRLNAVNCLSDERACGKIELSSIVDLTMLWNRGISFGVGQSDGIMRWLLVVLTTAIAIGFAVWLVRAARKLTSLALALVIGGAVGNVIDRVRFGAVVDFIDFSGPWFGVKLGAFNLGFPYVFNVADAAISVGAVLLFADQFLMSRQEKSAGAENEE